ncbi:MAG: endonuclease III domain-containing protein [Elusimicrobia bacterium]|nr:endonuclease III domain-containing protein [Elusimicrobiota bacterium]
MLARFGPQGWWPVTPARGSAPAYRPGVWDELTEAQRLEVCVGALLTQNTAWTNASRAVSRLVEEGAMRLDRLASMPGPRLERLIRSSGYFRQKALKVKAFASHARGKRGGLRAWLSGPLSELREELLSLHGIGQETADSILLYAGGRAAFVVDAYTLRIGSRLGWYGPGSSYREAQAFLVSKLPSSARLYAECHALFVELAKQHCRKTPSCEGCPLRRGCRHGRGNEG